MVRKGLSNQKFILYRLLIPGDLGTWGQVKYVSAFGIERITNRISEIDNESISRIFSEVPVEQIARPSGEVELLVGYDYAGWHPIKELCREHLLLNNQFGKCFGGNHPSVKECTQRYANNVSVVSV